MIPSIATYSNNAASSSRLDTINTQLIAPVTPCQVQTETSLQQKGQNAVRFRDELFWFENDKIASLDERITFINKVTDEIFHTIPSKDMLITLISLGSGGLLTEAYIHQQLKQAGYKHIAWRMIDVFYSDKIFQKALKQFRTVVEDNCRAFTTEQAYFNKAIGQGSLVEDDKIRGEIIVLSINPPTLLEDPAGQQSGSAGTLLFAGMPQSDHSKANAIFLLLANEKDKSVLDQRMEHLSNGKTIAWSYGLKCYLDNNGRHVLTHSSTERGRQMYKAFAGYFAPSANITPLTEAKTTLDDIAMKADEFLTDLEPSGIIGQKYLTSDYDVSLLKLQNGFVGRPNPALFASFDKNEIEIKKLS